MSDDGKKKEILGEVVLKDVRISYVDRVWKAKSINGGEPTFGCNFLINPEEPSGKKMDDLIRATIAKVKRATWVDSIPKLKASQLAYRDGNEQEWDGYQDMWYLSTNNKNQPIIVDRHREELTQKDNVLFAGCRVNAVVRFWGQPDDEGKEPRVNCTVETIQYVRKDVRLGAKPVDPKAVFEDLGDDEDDEDGEESDDDRIDRERLERQKAKNKKSKGYDNNLL